MFNTIDMNWRTEPPAARLQVLDHYWSGSETRLFSPRTSTQKSETHNLNRQLSLSLSRFFTNQCQRGRPDIPVGSVDESPPTVTLILGTVEEERWQDSQSHSFRQHALPSFWILHFVSKWWAVCFSCMAATARYRNTPWRGLTSLSPVSSTANPVTRIPFDWY